MKLALQPVWVLAAPWFIACGGSSGAVPNGFSSATYGLEASADVTTGGQGVDSGGSSSGGSSSGSQTGNDGGTCTASCSVDSDCQSACPSAPSGSSNCCSGGSCYLYAGAACQDVAEAGTAE
jgi:hypothetical protein